MGSAYFDYKVTDEKDEQLYKAPRGTVKITGIRQPDENGVIAIPNEIDGLPVTFYDAAGYFGPAARKLVIPRNLTVIGSVEYLPETELGLEVDSENPVWSTDGISLLTKDGTKLLRMCQKQRESYSVPEGVTTLGSRAFKFSALREITLPDSVTRVEQGAFQYCSALQKLSGGMGLESYETSSFSDTPWYRDSKELTVGRILIRGDAKKEAVVIPEGIAVIGPKAFDCDWESQAMLETVQLPSTLKVIGDGAFSGKKGIKEIRLPEGLTAIGSNAFSGCGSLTEIRIPASVKHIGTGAFNNCEKLASVEFAGAVAGYKDSGFQSALTETTLSESLFENCCALKTFTVPEGITAIGQKTFMGCTALEEIRLPDSIREILSGAFSRCLALESITLPKALTVLGSDVFPQASASRWGASTPAFGSIYVAEENETFRSFDGILCSKDGKTVYSCPALYAAAKCVIPEGVTRILPGAFKGCSNIRAIELPDTVTEIGKEAFASMPNLEEAVLPKRLEALEESLFADDGKLKTVVWPEALRQIGKKCFAQSGIEALFIPETVESVGDYAFMNIKAKSVTLPKTVKTIGWSVFSGVPSIEVYDTADADAKPAESYLDDTNGSRNGWVGFVGIYQKEGYMPAACNAIWEEHTVTVRSAADDRVKFRVRMPGGQKRKVYCTYVSSWGKNAQFNFAAVEGVFKDLTADAKEDFVLGRLRDGGISESFRDTAAKYIARNAKQLCGKVMKTDEVELLAAMEPYGIVKKATAEERLQQADSHQATACKAWLLDWQNKNTSGSKPKKESAALSLKGPTVAEIKKIWPHKKGKDGGITVTGYNGRDVDAVVPAMIGKTPVTAIGENCFSNAKDEDTKLFLKTELRSVTVPDSVVTVGYMAFYGCEALEKVQLPKNLTELNGSLFSGCKKLVTDIPAHTAVIKGTVFENCPIDTLHIPAATKMIDKAAFGEQAGFGAGMPALRAICVAPQNKHYRDVDGVLFTADMKTLVRYPQARAAEEYAVPEGVTCISGNAFALCGNLKRVMLPDTVEVIEAAAFYNCTALEGIGMPGKLKTLQDAFSCCASLKEIVIPRGITELPGSVFWKCTALEKVTLPGGLRKIGGGAFAECGKLTRVNVPASVRGIGEGAFANCKALETLTVYRGATGLGYGIFRGCGALTVTAPVDSKIYAYAKNEKLPVKPLEDEEA